VISKVGQIYSMGFRLCLPSELATETQSVFAAGEDGESSTVWRRGKEKRCSHDLRNGSTVTNSNPLSVLL
jgi:hypothetical protein